MPITRRSAVRALFVLTAIVLCALPWLVSAYSLSRMSPVFYTAVAILSLTVAQGLVGQFSIGQAAFMGLGAYTAGILVASYGWSYAAGGAVAVVLTGLVAAVLSVPSLQLRGLHVVMVTLGIGLVFPALVQRFSDLTGGTAGLPVFVPLPMPTFVNIRPDIVQYFLLLLLLAITMLVVRNLKESRTGRALVAVRDHQVVAESLGIHVARMKVVSFGLSGAIAGLAGVMFTINRQFVSPADFSLTQSINLFIGLAVAGPVSVGGAFVGSLFLQFTGDLISRLGVDPKLTPLIFGLVLLLITYFLRGGVGGLARSVRPVSTWPKRSSNGHAVADRPPVLSGSNALRHADQGENR